MFACMEHEAPACIDGACCTGVHASDCRAAGICHLYGLHTGLLVDSNSLSAWVYTVHGWVATVCIPSMVQCISQSEAK